MKITGIEAIPLRFEYPAGCGFTCASGYCTARVTCLIRVLTDGPFHGLGSVYSHSDLVRILVDGQFRDLLVGEDPLEVEELWDRMYNVTRWYGRKGVALSTLGGIDIALWDIRGKAAGKPIYEMLGACRHGVPAYASALLWRDNPNDLRSEAARYIEDGFRAMKMRLGRTVDYDLEALAVVRETIGPQNRLMVDANARYTLAAAQRLAPVFKEQGAFWLEEPFQPEALDDFRALRGSIEVPVAAGENEFGVQGFRELIDSGAVDIVQPDCCRAGGITECRRVGLLALKAGLRVAPHTWSDAVALAANMQLVASLANGITVEMDRTGNPFIDQLTSTPFRVVEGEIAMPQAPGLGIELNETTVGRYAVSGAISVGHYSDMLFGRAHLKQRRPYTLEETPRS